MPLEGVDARGRVRGLMFELTVEQRYRNTQSTNIEAVYTFPLPTEAVLLDLDITLGERKLSAVAVEKRAAERDYEAAIEKGDSALMLERAANGLCTLNLGNLLAGESATIRYRYAQLLRFEHGSVRVAIPTVIAPRYGDARKAGLDAHQVPDSDLAVAYPFALSLDLEGDIARGAIASPSHAIVTLATAMGVNVSLARGAWLDRDFVLTIAGLEGRSLATVAKDGDRYVALASFCAGLPHDADQLPLAVKLVVDCSGSMNGDSIAAAKRALHRILASLHPADRFSLTRFGSTFEHVTQGMVPGDAAHVRAVAEAVGRMDADLGGTEMLSALQAVFALDARESRGTGGHRNGADVFVLTDGEVWATDEIVAAARAANQRVFVVGIGSAPTEATVRGLGAATGGAAEFVAPNEDAEAAILRMFARIRAPRVQRADIAWPASAGWTTPLPTGLFGGETIHVFAGFDTAPSGDVKLALHAKSDAAPLAATARLPAGIDADRTLARMAASTRIAYATPEEGLKLALDYGLLTDRTNLIVVHERAAGEKAVDLPQLAQVAQMHAAGWGGVGSARAMMESSVQCNMMAFSDFDALDEPQIRYRRSSAFDSSAGLAALEAFFVALLARAPDNLPSSLEELARMSAPSRLVIDAKARVAAGEREIDVVRAIVEAVWKQADRWPQHRIPLSMRRGMRGLFRDGECAALRAGMLAAVDALLATRPQPALGRVM